MLATIETFLERFETMTYATATRMQRAENRRMNLISQRQEEEEEESSI